MSWEKSTLAEVQGIYCHCTERAIGFWKDEDDRKNEPTWIPLSLCEVEGDLRRGGIITLTADQSLLEEKGLV